MLHRPWLWINRTLSSKVVTPILIQTSLTPNQITIMSMCSGLLSGIFLSLGTYESSLWGVLFFEFAYLLDNSDGEIARLKNMKSEIGAKLDILCDMVTDTAFFIGIFIGALRWQVPGPLGLFFWLSIIGLAATYFIVMLEKKRGFGPAEHGKANPTGVERNSLIQEILNAVSEGEISIVIVLLGIFGLIYWLTWLIPVYINALWIINLARNFKWMR